jgi:teichuronic acid biosynthesis glycosyltransferase TuaH
MFTATSSRSTLAGADPAPAQPPRDVILALSFSTYGVSAARGFCFPEDRLVQTLLDHRGVARLLVADPFRSLPIMVARDLVAKPRAPAFASGERARLHRPARLRRADPVRPRAAARAAAAYERSLRRAADRMGLTRPAVIANHPFVAGFGSFEWAGPVTYYAWDDWRASEAHRRWWPAFEAAFAGIRETGRAVVAVSDAALERVAPIGPGAVVPNGLEPAEWMRPGPAPAWFCRLPRPRLLYVGSLQSRVDVTALRMVAAGLPSASVVLVGPLTEPDHFDELAAMPNVHIWPRVGRADVGGLVASADVCLLAHVRSELTEAMSPLKLYEYLAGGRPVVATDLPPVRGIDDRVLLVPAGGDYVAAVRRALALGSASEAERRAFVAANAWRHRHDEILSVVLRAGDAP